MVDGKMKQVILNVFIIRMILILKMVIKLVILKTYICDLPIFEIHVWVFIKIFKFLKFSIRKLSNAHSFKLHDIAC